MCDKGIRVAVRKDDAPSILGSRGIVGTAGRGLCWEVRYWCSALKLDGVGDFASLFALREYKVWTWNGVPR